MSTIDDDSPSTPACEQVDRYIRARDGWMLAITVHHAASDHRVALIASAIGARRGRYTRFARHLAASGWTTITFDYRGIGHSRGRLSNAREPSLLTWGQDDIDAVITWAAANLRPAHMAAVVHSIGGQLIAMAPNHRALSAVIAVSAPRHHWWLFGSLYGRLMKAFFQLWVPAMVALWGRLPMRFAGLEDLPPNVALDWASTSLHRLDQHPTSHAIASAFELFSTPTLMIGFADDHYIAPPRTVSELANTLYQRAECTRLDVVPREHGLGAVGHSGFFDGKVPLAWWDDAARWLDRKVAGLPGISAAEPQRKEAA